MIKRRCVFVIEHLEPELWPWCIIEYKHISNIVGKENLWFTNINKKDFPKLEQYGSVFRESVKSMNLPNSCILDPEAKATLSPKKAKDFSYFVFGGILGDYPPRKRTKEELTKFMEKTNTFNIRKEQMSTDNAVFVVKEIYSGKNLKDMKFKNSVDIKINEIESTTLPYKYAMLNKKPLISKELIEFIRKQNY